MRFLVAVFFLLFPGTVLGNPPILPDTDTIDLTTNFRGTEIAITTFVAEPEPDIRLVISGPPAVLTFRQKARRAGLWINTGKEELVGAASYVALVGISEAELNAACARFALSSLIPSNTLDLSWLCNREQRALMANKGLFSVVDPNEGIMDLGQGFHRAAAFLPPTAKPGTYTLRFWVDDESTETTLDLRRAGLERLVLTTAQNQRLFYGILCLVLAALAGYLTNLIFSRRS